MSCNASFIVSMLSAVVISALYTMENCLLLKLYRKLRKMLLSPRQELNPQPSDLQWDALQLPGLRWQTEGHDVYRFVRATHVVLIQQSRYLSVYLINEYIYIYIYQDDLQLGKLKEFQRRESNPQTSDLRWDARRSEGCVFDSRVGLRKVLLSLR